jgi:O-succinylbenzoic acid--CoA ligase
MELVRQVWAAGAAVMPIDSRMPRLEADALLSISRPTVLITAPGGDPVVTRLDDGRPVDEGVVLVVHTSGTAGDPKFVEFDRGAIDGAVAASAFAPGDPSHPWICCLPLARQGMLVSAASCSGTGVSAPVVRPLVRAGRRRFVSIVPTMLGRLLDARVDRPCCLHPRRRRPPPPGLRTRAEAPAPG